MGCLTIKTSETVLKEKTGNHKMAILVEAKSQYGGACQKPNEAIRYHCCRWSRFCLPALEWLVHTLPLGENSPAGSVPLSRSDQAVLIRGARTQQHMPSQLGVAEKEPQDVGSNPGLHGQGIHVRQDVHQQRVFLAIGKTKIKKKT